jgi:hypothetical protein
MATHTKDSGTLVTMTAIGMFTVTVYGSGRIFYGTHTVGAVLEPVP